MRINDNGKKLKKKFEHGIPNTYTYQENILRMVFQSSISCKQIFGLFARTKEHLMGHILRNETL